MRFSRKGSMELSINSIVVIVLALTMLGLGLSFIKGQVQKMGDTSTSVQQQMAEQIESQLRSSGDKMSYPRELTIARKEKKVITLGIQNTENNELYYKIFLEVDCPNTDDNLEAGFTGKEGGCGSDESVLVDPSVVRYDSSCLKLGLSESATHGISITAPASAGTASIRARIVAYTGTSGGGTPSQCKSDKTGEAIPGQSDEYASKLTFISIA